MLYFIDSDLNMEGKMNAASAILQVIDKHTSDEYLCHDGCMALWKGTEGNSAIHKKICEEGGLKVLLKVLTNHSGNKTILETCCFAIGVILSSREIYNEFKTNNIDDYNEVLGAIEGCYERNKSNNQIKQAYFGLKREEDPRVVEAVKRGECTKKRVFDPPQKGYRCYTCEKYERGTKFYCETCWKKDHQGHECEEFFYPVRCQTK